MPHQMLYVDIRKDFIPDPIAVVIDESILTSIVEKKDIRNFKQIFANDEILKVVLTEHYAGRSDPRPALLAAGHTTRSIRAHARGLKNEKPAFHPESSEKVRRTALRQHKPPIVPAILENLADEMDLKRPGLRSLVFAESEETTVSGERVKVEVARLQYRKKIALLRDRPNTPLLYLDATGDPLLLSPVIPTVDERRVTARRNAYVVHTYGLTAAKTRLVGGKDADRLLFEFSRKLVAIQQEYGNVALITYKDAEARLKVPDGVRTAHFGGFLGIDEFKDSAAIVVLGRNQLSPLDVERHALGLFYDTEIPLRLTGEYVRREVGINLRSGEEVGLSTWRHECDIIDRVRWQFTEAQNIQALDRGRLVHRGEVAQVYLLNEAPLPIWVDEVVPYRAFMGRTGDRGAGAGPGARLSQAYAELGGVLPLSAGTLARRFPALWKSSGAAANEIQAVGDPREFSLRLSPPAIVFELKRAGRGGRPTRILASGKAAAERFVRDQWGGIGQLEAMM